MNNEMPMIIVKNQHISEKSTIVSEKNKQFVFKVAINATKHQVKHAIESLFNVKVKDVTVLNVKGKTKRFKNTVGKRSDWKKAYVRLQPDFDIDFTVTE